MSGADARRDDTREASGDLSKPSVPLRQPSVKALEAALEASMEMWPTNAARYEIIEAAVRAAYAVDFAP